MKTYIKYLTVTLTTLFILSSKDYKAQDTVGCVLTPDECRKVLVLKNQRDSYYETLRLTEQILDSVRSEVGLKDSTINSYVIIDRNRKEMVEIQDIVNKELQQTALKQERKLRFQRGLLRISIPVSVGLGFLGGVYITSFL